ncbi:MAG: GNAT family N-acetyltransferase [Anaerolineae bacterium]|nr:GNAT family N-acetyltransferase [Anaerolineae bacterium]
MIIRPAHPHEIEAIRALFAGEVAAGRMLPRAAHDIRARLDDWLVAEEHSAIAGCVSLVQFNPALCEVRSLAVDPAYRGRGIASALVREALAMAERRGMERVLVLTRAAGLFEKLGFRRDFVANFPEKVWRDCAPCPFRHACDEIALIYPIREPVHAPYPDKEPTVARRS